MRARSAAILCLALAACSKTAGGSAAAPPSPSESSPSPSPIAVTSPSPSPSPSPACVDRQAALAAMAQVQTKIVAFATDYADQRYDRTPADARAALVDVRKVEGDVASDPTLEAEAKTMDADLVLQIGAGRFGKEAGDAFARLPTDFGILENGIGQAPTC